MDASERPDLAVTLAPQPREKVVEQERTENPNARPVMVFEVTAFMNNDDPKKAQLSFLALTNFSPLTERYDPLRVGRIMRSLLPQLMQTVSGALQGVLDQVSAKEMATYLQVALAAMPPAAEPPAEEPSC